MNQVHLIGNAHLDPAWLWRWTEGYTEVLSTFRSALDRMKEYGGYIFTCAGAAYYSWVEETDPAMFGEIRARVCEGRWVIVGGWWIQPDCNLPGGESFARHALYGQRYFQSRFGLKAQIGYNVDSFGHNAMIPQILRQSGMRGYVYMRPGAKAEGQTDAEAEKSYPFKENAFLWQSPDGTRVPAYRIPRGYGSSGYGDTDKKARQIAALAEEQALPQMCFYGVGNHGGGPTAQNLTALDALIAENPDGKYIFSSPDAYFDSLPPGRLPVLEGELQNHASGCYTAVMKIKEMSRRAETALLCAEKFASMARLLGLAHRQPVLEDAWRTLLFNQFHDIMGGCSIKSACDDALCALGGVIDTAARAENDALQRIFWNIDTLHGEAVPQGKYGFRTWDGSQGVPVAVFNPHGWDVDVPVSLPMNNAQSALDEDGNHVPIQSVRAEMTADIAKYESVIDAHVPAMGYRVYRLFKERKEEAAPQRSLYVAEHSLENGWTRLVLDPRTGEIVSFMDKQTGRELIGMPCRSLVIDESHCDTWAHAVFRFDREAGVFDRPVIRIAEEGAVRAAIEVESRYGDSAMRRKFVMYRSRPGVFIFYHVFWGEKQKMLKLCFPLAFAGAAPVSSIPYGHLTRCADGREYPMQTWVAMTAGDRGLGVATDSRTAFDATDRELRITALRSPIYANHMSAPAAESLYTDQGDHFFTLYLCPVAGDTIALQHAAACLACPPRAFLGSRHHGTLPECGSAASCNQDSIAMTAMKAAEGDRGELIVRCHELSGRPVRAKLTIGETCFEADFGAQQIRTFRIRNGCVLQTDMVESDDWQESEKS